MKNARLVILLFIILSLNAYSQQFPYLNPSLPVNERVQDLLDRMSLEEKAGQMCQYVGLHHMKQAEEMQREQGLDPTNDAFGFYKGMTTDDMKAWVKKGYVGSFLHVHDWEEANELQRLAEESPLKIPVLMGIDAIHGHSVYPSGATIFPSPIGLSCSWDTALVRKAAQVTALEMRATGYHWTFSPNVDVARDPRWGRTGETFGEDSYLVSLMGSSMVKGYQGKDFSGTNNVLACAKHFIAGSQPVRGLNFSPMDVSERNLRGVWFPPYQKAVAEGCYTVMAAHNEINGVPCHGNDYLLTDILKGEWDFNGFVVSDWTDISRLYSVHKVAETRKDADAMSVNAGMDMHMHGPEFFKNVIASVKDGTISMDRIDDAVSRILYAKFQMGLFEKRFVTKEEVNQTVLVEKHRNLTLHAARKSLVLLKNENNLLPLDKNLETVFVTGPNADNGTILGDWAVPQPEENLITVLEGISQIVSPKTKVSYQAIEDLRHITDEEIMQSVAKAEKAEVAIVVVGGNSMRHKWDERTCGENADRASLNLFGRQLELIQKIYETGTPTVVVLVNGRPLAIRWCAENIPAILEAWEPGLLGGKVVAETLFGDNNPSGKLTITFPRSTGQIPCFYNYKPAAYFRNYVDEETGFLFPFGFGLSYTRFEYSDLVVPETVSIGEPVEISVRVSNTGAVDGDEIVIVFTNDEYSSVTTPVKEMKAFQRVSLKQGESKTVHFTIRPEQLSMLDKNLRRVIEPGTFEVMVGDLKGRFEVK